MKKIFWLLVAIVIIVVIVVAVHKQKTVSESPEIVSNVFETVATEKKMICTVGPEVETDWCKLPTGQRLLLSMTGDAVYDNGDFYSFSRNNTDQGVRLYKTEDFTCSSHPEAVSCDGPVKLLLTALGSKDFYNSILKQLNDTYLQTRKDTDPQ